ncbi:hypothetical protein OZX73_05805 [Bifidobacterium sp. ESL0775]|uniref:hypothetical protein n=1 Tax=Bifidobacterium sp. ESL0775 TaxID=2983230 RepID=UPI0023F724F4|nr:hypothetical protein [Bifidobacterium sp. ESL0775]WEV68801.1 hypothetical protein OZX73_05805 [Bifidobacterium sp. ESL0775]
MTPKDIFKKNVLFLKANVPCRFVPIQDEAFTAGKTKHCLNTCIDDFVRVLKTQRKTKIRRIALVIPGLKMTQSRIHQAGKIKTRASRGD